MSSIDKAIKLKKELDSLRPLDKDVESRIMEKFKLDWNYHSNHLEGNTLTYGETKALILFNITAQGKPLKDHFEVTGHNEAINLVLDIIRQDRALTENFIRELHKLILKEPYEIDAITPDGRPTKKKVNIGTYKTLPNHVVTNTGEIFRFATPEETPALMNDLIDWYRSKLTKKNTNPLLLAAEFHYKIIRIHPFDDGNGRIARILMNFILLQHGFPPVIIKTEDKQNYYSVLRQADAGILKPFIEYIAENLVHSLELMIKGAKGQSIEEPDDIDKEVALLEQRLETFGQSIKIVKNQVRILQIYDNSIFKLISKFIEKGKLFEKFYAKSGFSLFVDDVPPQTNITTKDMIVRGRKNITTDTSSIRLEYNYTAFQRVGFEEFNFKSKILITFEHAKYVVADSSGNVEFKKLYGEQLNDDEINQLISSEIRKHTAFIEEKAKNIKNEK